MTTPPAPQRASRKLIVGAVLAGAAALAVCGVAIGWIFTGNPAADDEVRYVTITSCEHSPGETRIGYRIKNTTTSVRSFDPQFRILDASGRELSVGAEHVRRLDPAEEITNAITLRYAEGVGATCEYLGEEE